MNKLPFPQPKLRIKFIILCLSLASTPLLIAAAITIIWLQDSLLVGADPLALMFFTLFVLMIALPIALVTAFIFARRIIRPIELIHQAYEQFGRGDLNLRIAVKTGDEIEGLANGFNSMADNLGRSIGALERDKEVIAAERNKFAVVLSGITDAVVVVDLNRNIVIFNNAAEDLLDFSASEVLGKPIDQVIRMYDKGQELFPINYCPVKYSGPQGIAYSGKAIRLLGKGNKESFVNLISGRIKDGLADNLGCILTMHDVTREKQLEEMRLDFVSMAAHELRTPLTSVKGYLDVVRKEATLGDEHRKFLDRAMISAAQLVDLVENLLSVSKIERGVFTINTTPLDWTSYVKQTVSDFSDRAKEGNLELTFTLPRETIPPVKADKLRIKEVLTNLISNAINYTKSGGKISVSIETNPEKTAVITHIQDTGAGIPKEAIPHLFTKFFRVSGALEQGSKGTGLGLYISKSIIDMHHGKIWVDSEQGKGSTFSFLLPV